MRISIVANLTILHEIITEDNTMTEILEYNKEGYNNFFMKNCRNSESINYGGHRNLSRTRNLKAIF